MELKRLCSRLEIHSPHNVFRISSVCQPESLAATVTVRNIWFEECGSDWEKYQTELKKKEREIQKLIDKNYEILKTSDDRIAAIIESYEEQLAEKDAVIKGMTAKLAHAEALIGRDSTSNAYLQRDIQKSADETGHKVLLEIKQLITATTRDRNDRILAGEEGFEEAYIENFNKKMTKPLEKAEGEAAANRSV